MNAKSSPVKSTSSCKLSKFNFIQNRLSARPPLLNTNNVEPRTHTRRWTVASCVCVWAGT
jgi:hypothetical protein